ncbi:MAG: hypothetical protein ACC628_00745 [Pirellulaceae bacterium]
MKAIRGHQGVDWQATIGSARSGEKITGERLAKLTDTQCGQALSQLAKYAGWRDRGRQLRRLRRGIYVWQATG